MSLFIHKDFVMHSGGIAHYKIDCDALTDEDIETLAWMIAQKGKFQRVYGVPRGGERLANALRKYCTAEVGPRLIVDDVYTTGQSMEHVKSSLGWSDAVGVVIFARGVTPDWIKPIFQMHWMNVQDTPPQESMNFE